MTDYQIEPVRSAWSALATKYARVRGNLTANEILSVVVNESNGDAKAYNQNDPSYGLMGVTLLIGKQFCFELTSASDLFTPEKNVEAGSGYMAFLKKKYGLHHPVGVFPPTGWIMMYNLGEPRFLRGERVPDYEAAFLKHRDALDQLTVESAT